jgi:thiamine-monophosphate kinase
LPPFVPAPARLGAVVWRYTTTRERHNHRMPSEPRMRDDGEFRLIARLRERLARVGRPGAAGVDVHVGIGDDAAVTAAGGVTVTSTEALVEGVHFRRDTAPPASIGHKALAVALSDLAAMGASAGEAYVALGIPGDLGEAACMELYDGVAAVAASTGTAVLGGDVTRSPALVLAVTVVGHALSADAVVGRDGASPDQALAVTGELGGAAAGLLLLDRAVRASSLEPELVAALRRRQLEPEPRLVAGAVLAAHGATAMIDVSDGLGADASQIAAASGVRTVIELGRLPIQAGVGEVASAAGLDALELAASGGEDYELLVVMPATRVEEAAAAVSAAGGRLTVIGRTAPGDGVEIRTPDGSTREPWGFDHLRTRAEPAGPG